MKLYLIRHAETVHNVGQAWAGTTDSPLTNHGILQIHRLAHHLTHTRRVRFTHVFASDLQRAMTTAQGICDQQQTQAQQSSGLGVVPIVTPLLQEQHFGSREGIAIRRWQQQQQKSQHYQLGSREIAVAEAVMPPETEASMRARATTFLSEYLFPALLGNDENSKENNKSNELRNDVTETDQHKEEGAIAVVAHGIILGVLWNCLRHSLDSSSSSPDRTVHYRVPETVPVWSNTGYMEILIHHRHDSHSHPRQPSDNWSMTVLSINDTAHLQDLRRTGGGIGSSRFDSRQRSIKSFFKS